MPLVLQAGRDWSIARAVLDIMFVPQPDEFHLGLQPRFQRLWEHGHPVLVPFPAANDDLSPVKIEITNPQLTALGNPHAGPVEQLDDQPMRAFLRHGGEQSPYLFLGEPRSAAAWVCSLAPHPAIPGLFAERGGTGIGSHPEPGSACSPPRGG